MYSLWKYKTPLEQKNVSDKYNKLQRRNNICQENYEHKSYCQNVHLHNQVTVLLLLFNHSRETGHIVYFKNIKMMDKTQNSQKYYLKKWYTYC